MFLAFEKVLASLFFYTTNWNYKFKDDSMVNINEWRQQNEWLEHGIAKLFIFPYPNIIWYDWMKKIRFILISCNIYSCWYSVANIFI